MQIDLEEWHPLTHDEVEAIRHRISVLEERIRSLTPPVPGLPMRHPSDRFISKPFRAPNG